MAAVAGHAGGAGSTEPVAALAAEPMNSHPTQANDATSDTTLHSVSEPLDSADFTGETTDLERVDGRAWRFSPRENITFTTEARPSSRPSSLPSSATKGTPREFDILPGTTTRRPPPATRPN